ncbi:MAG: hypothetical protein R3263_03895 [Myxococcota bacterium]|nr:hypothetical protein [Myxococcota bacterium]
MPTPSIKGSIFRGVVEEIRQLRDGGRLSEAQLEGGLAESDLELLDQKILDASWYPTESYARMLDLLCRHVGGGRPGYYAERGAANARRLMDAGMYSQLDLLDRWRKDEEGVDPDRDAQRLVSAYQSKLKLVVSLAGSIYNTGRWRVEQDPEHPHRVIIEIADAGAYTDGMRYAIEGFLNECARTVRHGIGALYVTDRPDPATIRIRMTEDLPELYRRASA